MSKTQTGGVDPAALAAAVLAGALTVFAPSGPWSIGGALVGATVLFIIYGYDVEPHRSKLQSCAFAAVVGLGWVLVLGYPLEVACSSDRPFRLAAAVHENPERRAKLLSQKARDDQNYSDVPPIAILFVWASAFLATAYRERRREEIAKGASEPGDVVGSADTRSVHG